MRNILLFKGFCACEVKWQIKRPLLPATFFLFLLLIPQQLLELKKIAYFLKIATARSIINLSFLQCFGYNFGLVFFRGNRTEILQISYFCSNVDNRDKIVQELSLLFFCLYKKRIQKQTQDYKMTL